MKSISLFFIRDKRQQASKPVVDEQHFTFLNDYDWMTVKKRKSKIEKEGFQKQIPKTSAATLSGSDKLVQVSNFRFEISIKIADFNKKAQKQNTKLLNAMKLAS